MFLLRNIHLNKLFLKKFIQTKTSFSLIKCNKLEKNIAYHIPNDYPLTFREK